jgi:hypothetical protein
MSSPVNITDIPISSWFSLGVEVNQGWRVDAATIALLAIIGDAKPEDLTRAVTASRLVLLPRLVPAMQLLNGARPARLPQTKALLSAVYGPSPAEVTRSETVGYFVEALHDLSGLPEYSFCVLEVKHSKRRDQDIHLLDDFRMATIPPSNLVRSLLLFGFALTISLFTAATLWQDGPAVLAITLMGFSSSLMGYARSWRPLHGYMESRTRRAQEDGPRMTKVIGVLRQNLVVVRCNEAVSKELYFGCVDDCWYRTRGARSGVLMATGSVALMISVLLLANCTWKSQVSIAVSYILLNAMYWGISLLPRRVFWDLVCESMAIRRGSAYRLDS